MVPRCAGVPSMICCMLHVGGTRGTDKHGQQAPDWAGECCGLLRLPEDLAVCYCSGLSRTDFARGTDESYTMVTRGMMQERIQVGVPAQPESVLR